MHWFCRASISALCGVVPLAAMLVPSGIPGALELILLILGLCCFPMLLVFSYLTRKYGPPSAFDGETRCRKCGYILRGITEPRCPECGERI